VDFDAMGRPRKPSKIKEIEGNRSKIAIASFKTDPRGNGFPNMPPRFTALEEELWMDVTESLPDGILSAADTAILERFVTAWARHREARIKLQETGLLVRSATGPIRNPLLVVINQAAREMHAAGAELGLSPVSRARLADGESYGHDPMNWLLDHEDDPDEPEIQTPRRVQ
jgi:P27 family predicted phage terminase small subunit